MMGWILGGDDCSRSNTGTMGFYYIKSYRRPIIAALHGQLHSFALASDVGLKEGAGTGVETLNTCAGLAAGIELGPDLLGQDLAKLDAPLIEGVESPDEALGGGAVLVDGQELTNRKGIQTGHEHRTGGTVALKDLVRTKGLVDTLGNEMDRFTPERSLQAVGDMRRYFLHDTDRHLAAGFIKRCRSVNGGGVCFLIAQQLDKRDQMRRVEGMAQQKP